MPERPYMWYIFEKRIVQGYQKLYFHVPNAQIQKYKNTNTSYGEVPERPNMWHSFEKRIVQGYQNDTPMCQMRKYINTNTQIQHMMKYQKDPICGIFLKRGLFKGIKNYIPICQTCKYTNTNAHIHKYSISQSARKTQHMVHF